MRPGTLHFCRVNGKIRGTSAPKQTSAETMWIGSLGPRMLWDTPATNFSIYTTKMEGAGLKILGTGAKFKQVPCQKNCRVNRALVSAMKSTISLWENSHSKDFSRRSILRRPKSFGATRALKLRWFSSS